METHVEFTKHLKKAMREEYRAVHSRKNPVALALPNLSLQQLQHSLYQYTIFPRNIVSFLNTAREAARDNQWYEVTRELTRNIGEELGTETGGVPHYDMLVNGLSEGIDPQLGPSLRSLSPSEATKAFIAGMERTMSDQKVEYVIGGTYALESSAVPELVIIRCAVNELFSRATGEIVLEGQLREFFRKYLQVWEPSHEE